jgi:uncharacterized protein (DUF1697 family)
MAELREILESLGCVDVRTYIQSGNVVFESGGVETDAVTRAVEARRGFSLVLILVEREAFERAAAANPYPRADEEPKTVHLYFFADRPTADAVANLEELRQGEEEFSLGEGVLYLRAPNGIARSKIAAKIDRALGVPATGRNWRTIRKLQDMISR